MTLIYQNWSRHSILQLKKDQKFWLFSLVFSECFHLYLRKPTAAKALPSFWCAASHMFHISYICINHDTWAECHIFSWISSKNSTLPVNFIWPNWHCQHACILKNVKGLSITKKSWLVCQIVTSHCYLPTSALANFLRTKCIWWQSHAFIHQATIELQDLMQLEFSLLNIAVGEN